MLSGCSIRDGRVRGFWFFYNRTTEILTSQPKLCQLLALHAARARSRVSLRTT
jgi:hypothetical protein